LENKHDVASLERRWDKMFQCMESGDSEGALYMLRSLADDGVAAAMAEIGVFYETGTDPVKEDLGEAIKWYRRAANDGNIEGLLAMARLHLTGQGVPIDYEISREYYQAIVEKVEDRRALFGLAWIFHKGFGVRPDLKRAEEFYLRAVAAEHLVARKWLAAMYWSNGRHLKAAWHWISAIVKIWFTALFNKRSLKLHRQL